MPHDADIAIAVENVRAFNRFYTKRIGLLDESLADSGLSLTEARVLFELAHGTETASGLIKRLSIDRGYLSRILKSFQRRGLIKRTRNKRDGRSRSIVLSDKGRAKFSALERETRAGVRSLLQSIHREAVPHLLRAMATIESSFVASTGRDIALRDLRPGDIGWIAHRQGLLYTEEYGWDASYEALVAKILGEFVVKFDPKYERCWIAERDGTIVGSVFLVRESEEVARLRLLYVEPYARGAGLGRKLVQQCTEFARSRGFKTIVLWTQSNLMAARTIYASEGYRLVKSEKHRSFGVDLIGETWSLTL